MEVVAEVVVMVVAAAVELALVVDLLRPVLLTSRVSISKLQFGKPGGGGREGGGGGGGKARGGGNA